MNLKDKIFIYVTNSKVINEALVKVVNDPKHFDDFKQHFYLQLLEMDEEKLSRAYLNGYLDLLCTRIMWNQWRSKNSSFYFLYKNPKMVYEEDLSYYNVEDSEPINFDFKQAELILKEKKETWLDKQYHLTLFKLYYEKGLNYRQISELTSININSIAQSIKLSVKYIKKRYKKI